MDSAAYHKTIMALDVAGYHDPKRTTDHRLVVHDGSGNCCALRSRRPAFPGTSSARRTPVTAPDDQLPAQVGKADLVAALHDHVLAELRRYKAVHSEGTHVQWRVAFHAGEVCQGSHGTVGDATSYASSWTPFPRWWTRCSRSLRSQGGKRLHVIALARACQRFTHGLADLRDAIMILEPSSHRSTLLLRSSKSCDTTHSAGGLTAQLRVSTFCPYSAPDRWVKSRVPGTRAGRWFVRCRPVSKPADRDGSCTSRPRFE